MIDLNQLDDDMRDMPATQLRIVARMLANACNTHEQDIAELTATLDKYRRAVRDLNDLLVGK